MTDSVFMLAGLLVLGVGVVGWLGWLTFKNHYNMMNGLPREVVTRHGEIFIQCLATPGRYVPSRDPPRSHVQLPSYYALGITWKEVWPLLKPADQKRWEKMKPV